MFLLKKALQDSQVGTPKFLPKAASPQTAHVFGATLPGMDGQASPETVVDGHVEPGTGEQAEEPASVTADMLGYGEASTHL